MSKEFFIFLEHDKHFFPGDNIKGFIKLDLKRSADIQSISLNFKGTAEVNGEKIILIDKTEILASPKNGQKYTVFHKGQIYTFDFEFKIPQDKSLPSYAKIPKIANITYFLTATPKQRFINFSNNLPTIVEEVKILDFINVDLPDYCREINMNNDLGFVNGSKTSQWNLVVSKSAFIRGSYIKLDCNINNFPLMKKSKAIKVSLIRHVHKTSSARVIEKKVLSSKTFDLHITEIASTQTIYINLSIPEDTPASVFPNTGRILSISYVLEAELNMKGVKAAIKLKDMYAQEAAIVVGTFTKGEISDDICSISSEKKRCHTSTMSNISLSSTVNNYQNISTVSLASTRSSTPKHFHGTLTDLSEVKPLERLDEEQALKCNTYRRSYLTRNSSPITGTRAIFGNDDIPSTNMRASYTSVPHTMERSLTPLPSIRMNGSHTISYSNQHSRTRPILLQTTPSNITVSSPHEIGPDDVINRGGKLRGDYFPDGEKALNYDGEKEEAQVPSLIRHDTVSTASSSEHLEYQYPYAPASYIIRNKAS